MGEGHQASTSPHALYANPVGKLLKERRQNSQPSLLENHSREIADNTLSPSELDSSDIASAVVTEKDERKELKDTSTKFLPYEDRLNRYLEARLRIFGNGSEPDVVAGIARLRQRPSRSSRRRKEFWRRVFRMRREVARTIHTIASKHNDNRPYARIVIGGHTILGLLDSGASVSCAGGQAAEKLMKLPSFRKVVSTVQTADATPQRIEGYVLEEVTYGELRRTIKIYCVPNLAQDLYLGQEFWNVVAVKTLTDNGY